MIEKGYERELRPHQPLDLVDPFYLYNDNPPREGPDGKEYLRAMAYWERLANDPHYLEVIGKLDMKEMAGIIKQGLEPGQRLLVDALTLGTRVQEDRLLRELLAAGISIPRVRAHELHAAAADNQATDLLRVMPPGTEISVVSGELTALDLSRPEKYQSEKDFQRLVTVLGFMFSNSPDPQRIARHLARNTQKKNKVVCDFALILEDDWRRDEEPGFSPTEREWYEQAMWNFLRDKREPTGEPVGCVTVSRRYELLEDKKSYALVMVGEETNPATGHVTQMEILRYARYDPQLVEAIFKREGFKTVKVWQPAHGAILLERE